MCGIAGFIDSSLTLSQQEITISKMLQSIIHRGTDHSSYYKDEAVVLGHNRLSIIDLSNEANQPYHSNDLVMIFNGEVYNYLEIQAELKTLGYQFSTNSDTEVVIKAYECWGDLCLEKFMGMWAFVIFNKKTKMIFCSRDRFGIKPFYYLYKDNKFYFASEIKALKDIYLHDKKLNIEHINKFLHLGSVVYKDETFFEAIKSLQPAHNMLIKNGVIEKISNYWTLKSNKQSINFEQAKQGFLTLFKTSVEQHLRSDVTLGTCLSGGIDSSSLAAMISKHNPSKIEAFNVYYDGEGDTDERKWVHDVIAQYPNINPNFITPTDGDIIEAFSEMTDIQDGPIPGSGIMSQYFLFKAAGAKKMKVMIDGQGADEYLAGYHNFYPYFFSFLLGKLKFKTYFEEIHYYSKNLDLKKKDKFLLHLKAIKNIFVPYEYSKQLFLKNQKNLFKTPAQNTFSFDNNKAVNWYDDIFYQHLNLLVLPNLLHYEDRNSMRFTIESRVPFLDHRIVAYTFGLPFDFKIKKGYTKYILRESLRNITPNSVLSRIDKKGFTTPGEVKWLSGPLAFLLEMDSLRGLETLFKMEEIEKLVLEFKAKKYDNAHLLWRLVSLNEWLKKEAMN